MKNYENLFFGLLACAWFALKIRALVHFCRGELAPLGVALALAFACAEPAALAAGRPRAPLRVADYSWLTSIKMKRHCLSFHAFRIYKDKKKESLTIFTRTKVARRFFLAWSFATALVLINAWWTIASPRPLLRRLAAGRAF